MPARDRGGAARGAALLALLLTTWGATAAAADSVNTRERTVTQVAEGVYVIRHPDAPTGFPNGNTTVIVGDREVLVVDSCFLPSEARRDIEQIRRWTTKPVRYLVNTHWHGDHAYGNAAYAEAFPQLTIIAHRETRKQLEGYGSSFMPRFNKRTEALRRVLETGREEDGKPLTEARAAEVRAGIAAQERVYADINGAGLRTPNFAFDGELSIDLGGREVEVKFLGRGNTKGDAVAYLPKEQILVAGDLVAHPVPYLGGGFPSELAGTLRRLARLDARAIVPGHGEVLRGDYAGAYLKQIIDFVEVVVAQVGKEVYALGNGPRNLEAVREGVHKAVNFTEWRQKFAGDDKENREFFDSFSMPGLITAAYREAWGN